MKNFLNQFRSHLTPMQLVNFEGFIFHMAGQMVPSYGGGKWDSVKMGDAWGLSLPVRADENGKVSIETPFGNGVDTDHKTASAIFTFLVLSWFYEKVYTVLTDSGCNRFENTKMDISKFVYEKANGINTSDFYHLTD